MNDHFHFREATNSDSEAVCTLVFAVLKEHGLSPDSGATDADLADLESSYLRSGGGFDVLINGSGEIVGTVGLFPLDARRCELRKMYLAASQRGRGLGRRLVMHALGRARELGFRRVELETASVLKAAGQLYESFGFRPFVPDHMSARCDKAYYLEII